MPFATPGGGGDLGTDLPTESTPTDLHQQQLAMHGQRLSAVLQDGVSLAVAESAQKVFHEQGVHTSLLNGLGEGLHHICGDTLQPLGCAGHSLGLKRTLHIHAAWAKQEGLRRTGTQPGKGRAKGSLAVLLRWHFQHAGQAEARSSLLTAFGMRVRERAGRTAVKLFSVVQKTCLSSTWGLSSRTPLHWLPAYSMARERSSP